MARALAGLAACATLLLVAGCDAGREAPPKAMRPVGLHLDQFPDLGLPPWRPVDGEDHVAIAIAGGSVRRLDLALQAPPARTDLEAGDAIARHAAAVLPASGWARVGEGRPQDPEQTWKRGDETLLVTAERLGGVPVLRWKLAPPSAP